MPAMIGELCFVLSLLCIFCGIKGLRSIKNHRKHTRYVEEAGGLKEVAELTRRLFAESAILAILGLILLIFFP